jgi:predicted RNA-binding protein with PIN domain
MVQEKIMQPDWLIIDGYNLLHQAPDPAERISTDLQAARHRLVRLIENTAHRLAPRTTIVFDGRESGVDDSLASPHLEVFFSPPNLSADTVIERLVSRHDRPERILVVTSDHAEHTTVSSAGAHVMSSQEFLNRCQRDASRDGKKSAPSRQKPTLGDLFPDDL